MQLSPHFHVVEFSCRSGEPVPAEYMENLRQLCQRLEVVRAALGNRPIRIISGYRSPTWNRHVKGAARSRHLTAAAADLRIAGISPMELKGAIERAIKRGDMPDGGVGLYLARPGRATGWVHLDTRAKPARWKG